MLMAIGYIVCVSPIYFKSDLNWNGSTSLSYVAADNLGAMSTVAATQSIVVTPVNDAPALTGSAVTLADAPQDFSLVIAAADLRQGWTDVDGGALSVANLSANHASLQDNGNGTWTVTPDVNYSGSLALSYAVQDGQGGSSSATQSVNLLPSPTVHAGVDYTLPAYRINLVLTGANPISGNGNALDNVLTGNAQANTLNGLAGNDTLVGGAGADLFVFTTALDPASNVDVIADFGAGDQIVLDNHVFAALGLSGALAVEQFHAGADLTGSQSAEQGAGLYYDTTTGALYYDADGFGGSEAVKFASLSGAVALSDAAFVIQG
jgi:hypothetical protein